MKSKKTTEYNEIQSMLQRTNALIFPIVTKLVKERLVEGKREDSEKVFTYEEITDRQLMPFVWQLEFPELFFDKKW